MNIKSNNAIDYFHSCVDEYSFNGNTNFFGFFQKGFIQKFFYYENYGSLGISFDVFLQDNRYISIDTDCLEILVNNNLVKSIKLTDLKLESSNKIDLCEYKVFSKVIMIKYIHNDPYGYYPVSLKILSKFSEYSTPLWGIKNLYVEKIECPGKCIVCNSTDCIGCGDKQQIGESVISGCSCNNKISLNNIIDNSQELLYDFSDSDDILDCKNPYLKVYEEEYSKVFTKDYESYTWLLNNDEIYSYYYTNFCYNNKELFLGGKDVFNTNDVIEKKIIFKDKYYSQLNNFDLSKHKFSSIKLNLTISFFDWFDINNKLVLKTSSLSKASQTSSLTANDISNFRKCYNVYKNNTNNYFTKNYILTDIKDISDNLVFNITTFNSFVSNEKYLSSSFGINYLSLYVSPCHKTCESCHSPSEDACKTCEANAELSFGKCLCKEGYSRDAITDNEYLCTKIKTITIIEKGKDNKEIFNSNLIQSSSNVNDFNSLDILDNQNLRYNLTANIDYYIIVDNISKSSNFCSNSRSIIGGYKENINRYSKIIISTNEENIKFYLKKLELLIITEDSEQLRWGYKFVYNEIEYFPNNLSIKQVIFNDDIALSQGISCYKKDNEDKNYKDLNYKIYKMDFWITSYSNKGTLSIFNIPDKFWGIYEYKVKYFECHSNCKNCIGKQRNDCIICSDGMMLSKIFKKENNNYQTSYSCICDNQSGYFMISNNYDPLQCSNNIYNLKYYYISDIEEDYFAIKSWKYNDILVSDKNIFLCFDIIILGLNKMNGNKGILSRKFEFSNLLEYSYIEVLFDIYQINYNFDKSILKMFVDNFYVKSIEIFKSVQTILCDKNILYKYSASFIYYYSLDLIKHIDYFNPTYKIEFIPNTTCLLSFACGWGINNLRIIAHIQLSEILTLEGSIYKDIKNKDNNFTEEDLNLGESTNNISTDLNSDINNNSISIQYLKVDNLSIISNYPYILNSNCFRSSKAENCKCYFGFGGSEEDNGNFMCYKCIDPNCKYCKEFGNVCEECFIGYSLINEEEVINNIYCKKQYLELSYFQDYQLKINLERFYKYYHSDFTGYSISLWYKFIENEELPNLNNKKTISIFGIDSFMITYNKVIKNLFNVKYTNNSKEYLSEKHENILESKVNIYNELFYEKQWVPITLSSLCLSCLADDRSQTFIEMSIYFNDPVSSRVNIPYKEIKASPKEIYLFNNIFNIKYRELKMWDYYIPVNEFRSLAFYKFNNKHINLILYYKFDNGYLKNKGSGKLIDIENKSLFKHELSIDENPPYCTEDEYYNYELNACLKCNDKCSLCYNNLFTSCLICKVPNIFFDSSTNSCNQQCLDNKIPNFKFDPIKCSNRCPDECTECNNIKGCISCKQGYSLNNGKCDKINNPEYLNLSKYIIDNKYSTKCIDRIIFLNYNNYNEEILTNDYNNIYSNKHFFFMDGKNFALDAYIDICSSKFKINNSLNNLYNIEIFNSDFTIEWQSTLKNYLTYIEFVNSFSENNGVRVKASIRANSEDLLYPNIERFVLTVKEINIALFDSDNKLSDNKKTYKIYLEKSIDIPFISSEINGGIKNVYYLGQDIHFSLKFFNEYVIKKSNIPAIFEWNCGIDNWISINECNKFLNQDSITITQPKFSNSSTSKLKYNSLYTVICKVNHGNTYYNFVGFYIIYDQPEFSSFFDYYIDSNDIKLSENSKNINAIEISSDYNLVSLNEGVIPLNSNFSLNIKFKYNLDTEFINNYVDYKWIINSKLYKHDGIDNLSYVNLVPSNEVSVLNILNNNEFNVNTSDIIKTNNSTSIYNNNNNNYDHIKYIKNNPDSLRILLEEKFIKNNNIIIIKSKILFKQDLYNQKEIKKDFYFKISNQYNIFLNSSNNSLNNGYYLTKIDTQPKTYIAYDRYILKEPTLSYNFLKSNNIIVEYLYLDRYNKLNKLINSKSNSLDYRYLKESDIKTSKNNDILTDLTYNSLTSIPLDQSYSILNNKFYINIPMTDLLVKRIYFSDNNLINKYSMSYIDVYLNKRFDNNESINLHHELNIIDIDIKKENDFSIIINKLECLSIYVTKHFENDKNYNNFISLTKAILSDKLYNLLYSNNEKFLKYYDYKIEFENNISGINNIIFYLTYHLNIFDSNLDSSLFQKYAESLILIIKNALDYFFKFIKIIDLFTLKVVNQFERIIKILDLFSKLSYYSRYHWKESDSNNSNIMYFEGTNIYTLLGNEFFNYYSVINKVLSLSILKLSKNYINIKNYYSFIQLEGYLDKKKMISDFCINTSELDYSRYNNSIGYNLINSDRIKTLNNYNLTNSSIYYDFENINNYINNKKNLYLNVQREDINIGYLNSFSFLDDYLNSLNSKEEVSITEDTNMQLDNFFKCLKINNSNNKNGAVYIDKSVISSNYKSDIIFQFYLNFLFDKDKYNKEKTIYNNYLSNLDKNNIILDNFYVKSSLINTKTIITAKSYSRYNYNLNIYDSFLEDKTFNKYFLNFNDTNKIFSSENNFSNFDKSFYYVYFPLDLDYYKNNRINKIHILSNTWCLVSDIYLNDIQVKKNNSYIKDYSIIENSSDNNNSNEYIAGYFDDFDNLTTYTDNTNEKISNKNYNKIEINIDNIKNHCNSWIDYQNEGLLCQCDTVAPIYPITLDYYDSIKSFNESNVLYTNDTSYNHNLTYITIENPREDIMFPKEKKNFNEIWGLVSCILLSFICLALFIYYYSLDLKIVKYYKKHKLSSLISTNKNTNSYNLLNSRYNNIMRDYNALNIINNSNINIRKTNLSDKKYTSYFNYKMHRNKNDDSSLASVIENNDIFNKFIGEKGSNISLKSRMKNLREMSFSILYKQILFYSNEFFSLYSLSDTYYLRIHRLGVFLLRILLLMFICIINYNYNISQELLSKVKHRDITLIYERYNVYNQNNIDIKKSIFEILLALPLSFILIIIPKLSEWMFRYNRDLIKFRNNIDYVKLLHYYFYKAKSIQYIHALNSCNLDNYKNDIKSIEINKENIDNNNKHTSETNKYSLTDSNIITNRLNLDNSENENNQSITEKNNSYSKEVLNKSNISYSKNNNKINNLLSNNKINKKNYRNSLSNISNNLKIFDNEEEKDALKKPNDTKLLSITKEANIKQTIKIRKYMAYLNFMKLNAALINNVNYYNFISEKKENFPISIAPFYHNKYNNIIYKYWFRTIDVKSKLKKSYLESNADFELQNDYNNNNNKKSNLFKDKIKNNYILDKLLKHKHTLCKDIAVDYNEYYKTFISFKNDYMDLNKIKVKDQKTNSNLKLIKIDNDNNKNNNISLYNYKQNSKSTKHIVNKYYYSKNKVNNPIKPIAFSTKQKKLYANIIDLEKQNKEEVRNFANKFALRYLNIESVKTVNKNYINKSIFNSPYKQVNLNKSQIDKSLMKDSILSKSKLYNSNIDNKSPSRKINIFKKILNKNSNIAKNSLKSSDLNINNTTNIEKKIFNFDIIASKDFFKKFIKKIKNKDLKTLNNKNNNHNIDLYLKRASKVINLNYNKDSSAEKGFISKLINNYKFQNNKANNNIDYAIVKMKKDYAVFFKKINKNIFKLRNNISVYVEAIVPSLLLRRTMPLIFLFFKFLALYSAVGYLIYKISEELSFTIKNGAYYNAIFSIILFFSCIVINFLLLFPLLAFTKTIILKVYESSKITYNRCSVKNILFAFFISNIDRAFYYEMIENINHNNLVYKKKTEEYEDFFNPNYTDSDQEKTIINNNNLVKTKKSKTKKKSNYNNNFKISNSSLINDTSFKSNIIPKINNKTILKNNTNAIDNYYNNYFLALLDNKILEKECLSKNSKDIIDNNIHKDRNNYEYSNLKTSPIIKNKLIERKSIEKNQKLEDHSIIDNKYKELKFDKIFSMNNDLNKKNQYKKISNLNEYRNIYTNNKNTFFDYSINNVNKLQDIKHNKLENVYNNSNINNFSYNSNYMSGNIDNKNYKNNNISIKNKITNNNNDNLINLIEINNENKASSSNANAQYNSNNLSINNNNKINNDDRINIVDEDNSSNDD